MLTKLFKLAYSLDKRGFHSEAQEIEEIMKLMAKRVGLKIEELTSLANEFDEMGETEIADKLDDIAKESKYKEWKGPKGEKPPARHDIKKPPKPWMDEAKKKVKQKHPDYSAKRINELVGDEWYNKMTDKSRDKVWKELGRKGKAEK